MTNQLYPAFFRLDRLQMLVVGAGAVGEEKLRFILKSSPNANVTVVAPWMGEELKSLLDRYDQEARPQVPRTDKKSWVTQAGGSVTWQQRTFEPSDVENADLIVAATDIKEVNKSVHAAAKTYRRLCNIADTPELCDFYLGSIVTRGPLKVAISTNGQSPTFAKRFRQWLEAELPELETTNLLTNLKVFRDRLTGNFQTKVRELNNVTNSLLASASGPEAVRRCPPGGCLLAAASGADPSTDLAPAPAPKETTPEDNKK
ncbi:MAG: bifunctional precorrin-2 dehydrogenase/sirohydrochlorin ferrochelatase [Bacteroidota bacterium]